MRAFVFLLILANLLFVAWSQGYLGAPEHPDAQRAARQLNADRLRVVARDEPPPLPEQKEKSGSKSVLKSEDVRREESGGVKGADLCLKLVDVPTDSAVALVDALAEKYPSFRVQRTAQPGSASFWVYIPPLASRKEAESKAAELKKLNVPEFYIVQDGGPFNRAISLGVFSSKEAASSRLEQLRGKGVRSAKLGERPGKPVLFDIVLNGPESQGEALRKSLAERLPEHPVAACKAANAAP